MYQKFPACFPLLYSEQTVCLSILDEIEIQKHVQILVMFYMQHNEHSLDWKVREEHSIVPNKKQQPETQRMQVCFIYFFTLTLDTILC